MTKLEDIPKNDELVRWFGGEDRVDDKILLGGATLDMDDARKWPGKIAAPRWQYLSRSVHRGFGKLLIDPLLILA